MRPSGAFAHSVIASSARLNLLFRLKALGAERVSRAFLLRTFDSSIIRRVRGLSCSNPTSLKTGFPLLRECHLIGKKDHADQHSMLSSHLGQLYQ